MHVEYCLDFSLSPPLVRCSEPSFFMSWWSVCVLSALGAQNSETSNGNAPTALHFLATREYSSALRAYLLTHPIVFACAYVTTYLFYVYIFFCFVCRLCSKMEALQIAERELEQQRKQHNVAVDKLLLQTQSLETALKTERHVVTEER